MHIVWSTMNKKTATAKTTASTEAPSL